MYANASQGWEANSLQHIVGYALWVVTKSVDRYEKKKLDFP